jgi:hypothetical protein
VSARVSGAELEIGIELFGGIHLKEQRLAIFHFDAGSVAVENKLSINQIAMILD